MCQDGPCFSAHCTQWSELAGRDDIRVSVSVTEGDCHGLMLPLGSLAPACEPVTCLGLDWQD
jgi:hypothetical protein